MVVLNGLEVAWTVEVFAIVFGELEGAQEICKVGV